VCEPAFQPAIAIPLAYSVGSSVDVERDRRTPIFLQRAHGVAQRAQYLGREPMLFRVSTEHRVVSWGGGGGGGAPPRLPELFSATTCSARACGKGIATGRRGEIAEAAPVCWHPRVAIRGGGGGFLFLLLGCFWLLGFLVFSSYSSVKKLRRGISRGAEPESSR